MIKHRHVTPTRAGRIAPWVLVAASLFMAAWVLAPGIVFAQQAVPTAPAALGQEAAGSAEITLTAIPPRFGENGTFILKPGEKTQVAVKVRNASSKPLRVDSDVIDFVIGEDGSTPLQVSDTTSNRWSLASWVVLSPSSQVLQPNEIGLVNVIVDVPADALPGGHYAMVTHRPSANLSRESSDENKAASAINQRVGTLLYGVVSGPINEEAFVTNFQFPPITEFGPVPYSFRVENVSDVHISPRTVIDITDVLGRKVATFDTEQKNVFPFVNRDFSGEWNKKWGTGYYRAKLTMSFGESGKVVVANTSFWLLPYRYAAAVAAGIFALMIVVLVIKQQLNKRHKLMKRHVAELEKTVSELRRQSKP